MLALRQIIPKYLGRYKAVIATLVVCPLHLPSSPHNSFSAVLDGHSYEPTSNRTSLKRLTWQNESNWWQYGVATQGV